METTQQEDKAEPKASSTKWTTEPKMNGKMKITVKLNKEEVEAFKNWRDTCIPNVADPNFNEDEFYRMIFFQGIGSLNEQLRAIAKQIAAQQESITNLATGNEKGETSPLIIPEN